MWPICSQGGDVTDTIQTDMSVVIKKEMYLLSGLDWGVPWEKLCDAF